MQVHQRTIEERVYQTLKVVSNSICVLYVKKKNGKKHIVQDYQYLNE